jgi:hypothetical protein
VHPYLKDLSKKQTHADFTMDESAILNSANRVHDHVQYLRAWLRIQNPNKLSGPALNEWVQEVINSLFEDQYAKQVTEASSNNASSSAQSRLRQEGGDTSESSEGVRQSRR